MIKTINLEFNNNYKNEIKNHFRNEKLTGGGDKNNTKFIFFDKGDKKLLAMKKDRKIKLINIENDIQKVALKHYIKNKFGIGHDRKQNILSNIKKINKKYMSKKISNEEYKNIENFLDNIENEKEKNKGKIESIIKKKKINDNNFEQKGGMLFYIIDHFLDDQANKDKLPRWISYVWIGMMELIDLILDIGGSIPGLQAVVGIGFILDGMGIIVSLLRMDFLGAFLGLFSLIPVVGDLLGAAGQIGQKGVKIMRYVNKASKHSDKVVTAIGVAQQVSEIQNQEEEDDYDDDDDDDDY